MHLLEIGWEFVDRINLVQDKGLWWAHVNMVVNLLFTSVKVGEFHD
jgi:hypothetical protein